MEFQAKVFDACTVLFYGANVFLTRDGYLGENLRWINEHGILRLTMFGAPPCIAYPLQSLALSFHQNPLQPLILVKQDQSRLLVNQTVQADSHERKMAFQTDQSLIHPVKYFSV